MSDKYDQTCDCKLNKKSLAIIRSLFNVKDGEEVYEALRHVPTENLKNIKDMIDQILEYRIDEMH